MLLPLVTLLFSQSSLGLSSPWVISPQQPDIKVRLLISGEVDPVSKTVMAGLEVKLADSWKTYWRSPGEGGVAPKITWQPSDNINTIDWLWPLPKRFELLGFHTLGYQNAVVFPLLIRVHRLDKPVTVAGRLELPSCTTVCILSDYSLNLTFTPSMLQPDSDAAFLINKGVSATPRSDKNIATHPIVSGIHDVQAFWDKSSSTLRITAETTQAQNNADVIVESDNTDISFGLPNLHWRGAQLTATVKASNWLREANLANTSVTVTIKNGDDALEKTIKVQPSSSSLNSQSLLSILVFALLGGLILNLMPCVLPVLGLKLTTLVEASRQPRQRVRQQFLSSAAGILFSFWLLAGVLLLLKLTGTQIGWGIQFQNPWFIGFMALITTGFAANLMGLFEIRLSSGFSTRIATAGDDSCRGHFIQGAFATLLATPCSAPFLGTAVAYALSTTALNLIIIFTALGLGLATPYLLVALSPALVRFLPKPGRWMHHLKILLALMLTGTSLWLINLLQTYLWAPWLLMAFCIPTVLFTFLLLKQVLQRGKKSILFIASSVLSLAIALIFSWSTGILQPSENNKPALPWQPLSMSMIQAAVAEGKVVFVDITADWCLTCKANKIRVLDRAPVFDALQQNTVVLMQGDWTRPSDTINEFLNSHDRYGVPFNIVYGPGAPQGIPLPELLCSDKVMTALQQASSQ